MAIKFMQISAALLMLGALAVVWSLADEKYPDDKVGVKLGEGAPDFTLPNSEGRKVNLKDYRGKWQVALVFYPALFKAGG